MTGNVNKRIKNKFREIQKQLKGQTKYGVEPLSIFGIELVFNSCTFYDFALALGLATKDYDFACNVWVGNNTFGYPLYLFGLEVI